MKREKGFTLIELLAVIIILSVIMVIAVPKVLDVINKSKEEAFIDSAYGISDSVKYYYFQNNIVFHLLFHDIFLLEKNLTFFDTL